ncbi:MAG: hypothetical protein HY741_24260 [Chloroflexi bacterium]|nr:hypothetical protein [Chloroflexota bacterium]
MSDASSHAPRRRPVDVLFGEEIELKPKPASSEDDARLVQTPGYMVEPPRPVTSVRPPPPEYPSDWRVTALPEPVTLVEPTVESGSVSGIVAPPPAPVITAPPRVEPIVEAVTFTPPARVETVEPQPLQDKSNAVQAPLVAPPPTMVAAAPAPLYGQAELLELSQFVDQLYQNVADETSDSAALNAECLATLNAARAAIEQGAFARAETSAEQVKARLLLARSSRAAAAAPKTRVLFAWLSIAVVGGLILFLLPFVLRLVPAVIPLLRGIGMGLLGGALAALWQMTRQIGTRAYEPAGAYKYAVAPLLGAGLGAVLYLLSLLGVLAAANALGIPGEPWLMYVFAFLGGVFGDKLFDAFTSWRSAKLRSTRNT